MATKKFDKFLQNEVKDHHKILTDNIIERMKDAVKYEKPWFEPVGMNPHNPVTGTKYKGVNFLIMAMQGYADDRFYTFNNIKQLAAETGENIHVRKGEKGIPVFKALQKTFTKEDKVTGEESSFGFWTQAYAGTVFNASQIEVLAPLKEKPLNVIEEVEQVELLASAMQTTGLKISHNSNKAYYQTQSDEICLPPRAEFKSTSLYVRTKLHELGHATGHPSRLNRNLQNKFGSPEYAKEELIAELTSYFLGSDLNIAYDATTHENHTAYLKSWLGQLENDKQYIFKCASAASRAVEYQLNVRDEYLKSLETKPALKP